MHKGSLQFYPRVRAKKVIPSVNWSPIKKIISPSKLLGFIGYKVGMVSVFAKDETPDSMTKGKRIIVPATVIECPQMKIYSIRFYKNNQVAKDVIVSNEKILKSKLNVGKNVKNVDKIDFDYDDLRVVVYSDVASTGFGKKSPDVLEIALNSSMSKEEKLNFVKEKIGKGFFIEDVFEKGKQVPADVRAVTKGYGTQGPVKRFGITLKSHKSEKGRRRPGSLAPWHPARVTFRTPMAGQTGYHNRVVYNNLVLKIGKISEEDINKKQGFHKYGNIKTNYILLRGSVPGTKKRAIVITPALRATRNIAKKKLEVLELR